MFKGGTLLRVCGLPDYRYSEDLDFDWMGSPHGFRAATAAAVSAVAGGGTFLNLLPGPLKQIAGGRGGSTAVGWSHQGLAGRIEVDASFVDRIEIPTQDWPIIRRHPDTPPSPPIRGYTLEAALSDKFSCISRRPAGRDFYDIDRLVAHGVDIHEAWALYTEQHNNLRRHYGWRPHPADIRTEYARRLPRIAADWDASVAGGMVPPDDRFIDVYARVDAAVADAQAAWMALADPDEVALDLERRTIACAPTTAVAGAGLRARGCRGSPPSGDLLLTGIVGGGIPDSVSSYSLRTRSQGTSVRFCLAGDARY